MAPSSALPIGAARAVSETQAVPIDPAMPGSGLLNAVLAILAPPVNTDESERYDEEILDLPISGFIVVSVFLHFPVSLKITDIRVLLFHSIYLVSVATNIRLQLAQISTSRIAR
jgi:hypothetical protein